MHRARPTSSAGCGTSRTNTGTNNEATSVFVSHIITNDLVYDIILLAVDPCTLVRLARTCRTAHAAVHSHIARTFKINKHLESYFSDPLAFRSLQAATGTLISGSSALQFLSRTVYPEADLDLYCFQEQRAVVGTWLLQQGYSFAPNSRQARAFDVAVNADREDNWDDDDEEYSMRAVFAVYTFTKPTNDMQRADANLKVQVVVANDSPMEAILHFHSTVVINAISYSHAYALYPRATFHDRVSLALLDDTVAHWPIHRKYQQRGWDFLYDFPPAQPWDDEDRSILRAFPQGYRWIGDKHSWVVSLNTDGVQLPAQPGGSADPPLWRDPSFVTTWSMENRHLDDEPLSDDELMDDDLAENMPRAKQIRTHVLDGNGLCYKYVISEPRMYRMAAIIRARHAEAAAGNQPLPTRYCDGELMRQCEAVFERQKLWQKWYP